MSEGTLFDQLQVKRQKLVADVAEFAQLKANEFVFDTGVSIKHISIDFLLHFRSDRIAPDHAVVSNVTVETNLK